MLIIHVGETAINRPFTSLPQPSLHTSFSPFHIWQRKCYFPFPPLFWSHVRNPELVAFDVSLLYSVDPWKGLLTVSVLVTMNKPNKQRVHYVPCPFLRDLLTFNSFHKSSLCNWVFKDNSYACTDSVLDRSIYIFQRYKQIWNAKNISHECCRVIESHK